MDEIATTGTKHMHIFIYSKSPIRFSTLKNRFPVAHIDKANGSVMENRDYLRKEGKWQGSDKEQTNLIDTFEEVGDVPKPVDENSPDMSALIEKNRKRTRYLRNYQAPSQICLSDKRD